MSEKELEQPGLNEEELKAYRLQLRDFRPLLDRRDPCLTAWELVFLLECVVDLFQHRKQPTLARVNKINMPSGSPL